LRASDAGVLPTNVFLSPLVSLPERCQAAGDVSKQSIALHPHAYTGRFLAQQIPDFERKSPDDTASDICIEIPSCYLQMFELTCVWRIGPILVIIITLSRNTTPVAVWRQYE